MNIGDNVMVKVSRDKERGGVLASFVNDRTVGVQFSKNANLAFFDIDRVRAMGEQQVAVKHDSAKTRLELIPASGIEAAGRAFTFGAQKYDDHNWANGFNWERLVGSTLRHLNAWRSGEDKDPESGLSHLDHALATLMMLSAHETEGLGNDDRRKTKN